MQCYRELGEEQFKTDYHGTELTVNLMPQNSVKADSISTFRERLDKFMDNRSVNGTKRMYPLTFLIHVRAWELLWE